jgi:2-dehydropantoate 2-reductase
MKGIMKIAILGAGSLGLITGAMITKAGYDCALVDVNKEHVNALNNNGAQIIGKHVDTIPVKAYLPQELNGIFDIVLLQTKQMHMLEALKSIGKNMNDNTVIVTLQNGVPEDKVVAVYGKERIISGSVFHGAKYIEPGVSELTTDFDCMHIYIGELDGTITPRIKELEKILLTAGGVTISTNILAVKWTKLIMNAALSGVSAALGCTFGTAIENYDSMRLMAYICNEGAKVMEKIGLTPIEMEGFLPTVENYSFTNKQELKKVEKQLSELISYSFDEVASMLQDIWAGRTECEIDDINGKVVQAGAETGIPTPYNEKIVEVVKKILKCELKAEFSNIKSFDFPELT